MLEDVGVFPLEEYILCVVFFVGGMRFWFVVSVWCGVAF